MFWKIANQPRTGINSRLPASNSIDLMMLSKRLQELACHRTVEIPVICSRTTIWTWTRTLTSQMALLAITCLALYWRSSSNRKWQLNAMRRRWTCNQPCGALLKDSANWLEGPRARMAKWMLTRYLVIAIRTSCKWISWFDSTWRIFSMRRVRIWILPMEEWIMEWFTTLSSHQWLILIICKHIRKLIWSWSVIKSRRKRPINSQWYLEPTRRPHCPQEPTTTKRWKRICRAQQL